MFKCFQRLQQQSVLKQQLHKYQLNLITVLPQGKVPAESGDTRRPEDGPVPPQQLTLPQLTAPPPQAVPGSSPGVGQHPQNQNQNQQLSNRHYSERDELYEILVTPRAQCGLMLRVGYCSLYFKKEDIRRQAPQSFEDSE